MGIVARDNWGEAVNLHISFFITNGIWSIKEQFQDAIKCRREP